MIRVSERKLHIDILRIFAAFLVIFNHTTGFYHYFNYVSIRETGLYIVLSVITKVAVPIFFMISGALLLGKEESYTVLFKKRILRFIVVLICASAVFYAGDNMHALGVKAFLQTLNIKDFVTALISGTIILAYWFLYAYLGFLCILPFLRKVAQKLEWSDMLMLVSVVFLINILPRSADVVCQYLGYESVTITSYLSIPFAESTILYFPIVGYYCEHKIPIERIKKWLPYLISVLLVGVLFGTAGTILQGVTEGFTQDYLAICQYTNTPVIYLLVKYITFKFTEKGISLKIQKAICTLGSLTLGVYLMDPMLHGAIYNWAYELVANVVHPVTYSVIYCFVSLITCSAITYALKRVPIVRKLL